MPVYFAYRSHYRNPAAVHVRQFDADTVVGWFRGIWKPIPEDRSAPYPSAEYADRLIGRRVYSFANLFERIAEHGWPPPRGMRELADRLQYALYVTEMTHGPHHVQILTDDDELEMAVYVFDGHYATRHPDRVAWLTREDWRLPDGAADGGALLRGARKAKKLVAGEGCTYFAHFAAYDSGSLTDLEDMRQCGRVDGVRVADFPRYLFAADGYAQDEEARETLGVDLMQLLSGLPAYLKAVRGDEKALAAAVRSSPDDLAAWSAMSDWLAERGRPDGGAHVLARVLAGYRPDSGSLNDTRNPKKDHVSVQRHVAQACKHVARWGDDDLYHHLILFDDLWAAAHPDLAASILRFASKWNAL